MYQMFFIISLSLLSSSFEWNSSWEGRARAPSAVIKKNEERFSSEIYNDIGEAVISHILKIFSRSLSLSVKPNPVAMYAEENVLLTETWV